MTASAQEETESFKKEIERFQHREEKTKRDIEVIEGEKASKEPKIRSKLPTQRHINKIWWLRHRKRRSTMLKKKSSNKTQS
mmetsp:Transcript_34132/g.34331  ORF Transcript_34132/g.34331 Transcript_34132/m.34331 type:complete len:81 (-) Transcript_34132:104-346(-)